MYGRTREEARRQPTRLLERADQGISAAAERWTVANYHPAGRWSWGRTRRLHSLLVAMIFDRSDETVRVNEADEK